jgi:ubiquinone/menaquinone biosynthesis C-methylase UbiE
LSRNQQALSARKLPDDDMLLQEILALAPRGAQGNLEVLEVGCGDGTRLAWIQSHFKARCHGIDPSAQAVDAARAKGVDAKQGTADSLEFEDGVFDIVIFGFCLYLCDRGDLFRIASEADRVLRAPGWLMILDFYSPAPRSKPYHHHPGVRSHKMDYRSVFNWHPDYECVTHNVRHHDGTGYTDLRDEWVAVSVLRKSPGDVDV